MIPRALRRTGGSGSSGGGVAARRWLSSAPAPAGAPRAGGCGGHGHGHGHAHAHGGGPAPGDATRGSTHTYGGRAIPGADGKIAPPGAPTKTYDAAALRATVRRGDYEGFLCGLFVPSAAHEAYFALRALNIELASIRDSTRGNAQAAHLRMAFWRDLVEA